MKKPVKKSLFISQVHFVLPIQIVLTLTFDSVALYGNITLPFVVL